MSKGRKRNTEQMHVPAAEVPQSFRELVQLSNVDLNKMLRDLNLPMKGKRNHKVTTLATYLGIPTTGVDADQDPFLQTLSDVKQLSEGWTGDIRLAPEIRLDEILKYILAAHDISHQDGDFETYNSDNLKTYKALRAYDLWESGHISGFNFNSLSKLDGYCAHKCVANPSGDSCGTQYTVLVILGETGTPIGASCTCVAGLGEACTHIAGLMFGIEEQVQVWGRPAHTLQGSCLALRTLCHGDTNNCQIVRPQQRNSVSGMFLKAQRWSQDN